ncbi:unnamed protein product [Lasius platythorax]|uniref:Uncharacterized protein n=1 Tax=Lasius platythorax TaxID=488582 RepID=A0AAV2N7Z5_9HYME
MQLQRMRRTNRIDVCARANRILLFGIKNPLALTLATPGEGEGEGERRIITSHFFPLHFFREGREFFITQSDLPSHPSHSVAISVIRVTCDFAASDENSILDKFDFCVSRARENAPLYDGAVKGIWTPLAKLKRNNGADGNRN